MNANFAQPIVTQNTVVVGSGDPWMNLGNTGRFRANSPATFIGDSFAAVYGLDPETGIEKWRVFSGNGTSAMTPLYHKGNLYWVNGEAKVWAVNADTGQAVAPFMTSEGLPTLSLGGFNAVSSANIYHVPDGPDLMIVGTAMPNRIWAIDLQSLGISNIPKGFTSPVPLIHKNSVYIHNPLTQTITSLSTHVYYLFVWNSFI